MVSRGLRSTVSLLETVWRLNHTSALPRVAASRRYLSSETSSETSTSTPEIPHAIARKKRVRPENLPFDAKIPVNAPYAMRERNPFPVNTDADKLNRVIERLVGKDIELPQDLKWQIVTHKSFDHGRQPFNQKLALFGETIVQFHAAQYVLNKAPKTKTPKPSTYIGANGDVYAAPEIFEHPDYKNLSAINKGFIEDFTRRTQVADIVFKAGLLDVLRWKPAQGDAKNVETAALGVARDSLMALVGALSLNKGADVAANFVREKILAESKR